jgi:regulator of protease activity HflC (stomatin/prohibitin superfamily)
MMGRDFDDRPSALGRIGIYAGLGAVAFVGIFLVSLFFGSYYTVHETERGIVLRNGAFVSIEKAGFGLKAPFITTVEKVDMTTQNYKQEGVESYSQDQQPAKLKLSVTFHVNPDSVEDFYRRFSADIPTVLSRLIWPNLMREAKTVFGHYTAQRVVADRGPLNTAVTEAIRQSIAYDPVVTIDSVQIEDIAWSPQYISAIEARMHAEVEVQQLQQNLARERVQAEITVTKAKASADATVAEATAKAQSTRMAGEAEAAAITVKTQALAQNAALIELTKAEKWNGALPVTMVPGATVPFLNLK